jgi:hypothetical protein
MNDVLFVKIPNPREGKGFGPHKCTRCGSNSTAFLGITVGESFIVLCKNCLNEGKYIVDKTILEQVRRNSYD